MNPDEKIIPIAAIYSHEDTKGRLSPAAQLLNMEQDIPFTPLFVAAACVSLYECFERHVEESKSLDFEMCFQIMFMELFKNRAEYMTYIPIDDKKDEY